MAAWPPPQVARLPGGRLHLQQGPIDIVLCAMGEAGMVARAEAVATRRFDGLLAELAGELPLLRRPLGAEPPPLAGGIARAMATACWPHRQHFITPMAAVAGAVADALLAAMMAEAKLERAFVNNGGDIAVHVAPGQVLVVGVVRDLLLAAPEGSVTLHHGSGIGGIATSGWRGRSFSLGIADAVTVLAETAAAADAAATIIANAVDVASPAIGRQPARTLVPDTDLGDLPVTVAVGPLDRREVEAALASGAAVAEALLAGGSIGGALLALQGEWRAVGPVPVAAPSPHRPRGLR
jgi:ApbE superfamily uncharacterized protein (UPF0280 family)